MRVDTAPYASAAAPPPDLPPLLLLFDPVRLVWRLMTAVDRRADVGAADSAATESSADSGGRELAPLPLLRLASRRAAAGAASLESGGW
jgi:hypothetical protein